MTITRGTGDTTGSGAEAYATVDGVSGLTYGMVYQLTSLAVTRTGARAMTQMEVADACARPGADRRADPRRAPAHRGQAAQLQSLFCGRNGQLRRLQLLRAAHSTAAADAAGLRCHANAARPALGGYDDPNASTDAASILRRHDQGCDSPTAARTITRAPALPPTCRTCYGSLGDTLTSHDRVIRALTIR